jgi:hypothetical protein
VERLFNNSFRDDHHLSMIGSSTPLSDHAHSFSHQAYSLGSWWFMLISLTKTRFLISLSSEIS